MSPLLPVALAPNVIEHFYRGGARIAALRGIAVPSDHSPEEWLAATVSRNGETDRGLARSVTGDRLADLVAADPVGWFGSAAPRASATDTGVLVKLLDAGQRLPVHVHPDRAFARRHLGCGYGKTEAWFVLEAAEGAAVHLGWNVPVDATELARARDAQDSAWLLERMHRLPVRAGDGILVPAGQVHALGEGVLVVEAQEPTDLSIVLEWSVTTSGREDSHLGLGFDAAMAAVSHDPLSAADLAGLRRHLTDDAVDTGPQRCLPEAADPFFSLDLLAAPAGARCSVPDGYAVLVVLAGSGRLTSGSGTVGVDPGSVWAVPAGFGAWELSAGCRAVLCRPGRDWPDSDRPGEVVA